LPSSDDATRKLRSGSRDPLLRVEGLCAQFPVKQGLLRRTVGQVRAVDSVDLRVLRGQVLAVVGEAGAGKTTLARSLCRLVTPTAGRVLFDGKDLSTVAKPELKSLLSQIQIVSPETFAVTEPSAALRALAEREPRLVILDEPFAALDDAVRLRLFAQIRALPDERGMTFLLLTQSLPLAGALADEIAVMHAGQIVETGAAASLLAHPQHPYTQSLQAAQASPPRSVPPISDREGRVKGCRFRDRCPHAVVRCAEEEPTLFAVPGGLSRCFLHDPDGADR
jgi:oligopeptide/dipeptide ABC transporter ATP-binding protein